MKLHQPQHLMEAYYAVYSEPEQDLNIELYEQVVEFLVNEGYAEDVDDADALIEELSNDEIEGIFEEVINRRGVSVNAAGQNIPWSLSTDTTTGRSTVRDRFGKRGVESPRTNKTKKVFGNVSNTMREQLDTYDLVLDYLMTEGFADDEAAATQIMAHMSEEWCDSIVEAKMEAGKSEQEKKDIRGRRYATQLGAVGPIFS